MSDSSTTFWFLAYSKFRFFTRIRRFLKTKPSKKQYRISDQIKKPIITVVDEDQEKGWEKMMSDQEQENNWMVLQRAVKKLHFGSWQEKEEAAKVIARLAKEDVKRRKLMAELGVIQPLVEMVGSEVLQRRKLAVQALIQLANGTFTNKAVMVEAGILSKLPGKVDSLDESTKQEFAQLILSVSSIASSEFPLSESRIIPFVISILDSIPSTETMHLCLGTMHNLSLVLENAGDLVTCGAINTLLRLCSSRSASEKALAILGNLVVTLMGKKALESNSMVPESLIEIMTWEENQKCQELSAYVLMILAHQSSVQRDKMSRAGIVPVLLEVALLGSSLAQKRALKLLQWFKNERQVRMGPHSGPQEGRMMIINSPENNREAAGEGKKLMKNIVKQSLNKNMERITRRASGLGDSSKFKALIASSSSKSLPY